MSDLISRKALIQEIEPMLTWELLAKINKMPAVDAVPVVHERWEDCEIFDSVAVIEEMQSAKCGNCGKYHTTPYSYYLSKYNYCPNCGAKMDGDEYGTEERN